MRGSVLATLRGNSMRGSLRSVEMGGGGGGGWWMGGGRMFIIGNVFITPVLAVEDGRGVGGGEGGRGRTESKTHHGPYRFGME